MYFWSKLKPIFGKSTKLKRVESGSKLYWHDKKTVSHPKMEFSVRKLEFFGQNYVDKAILKCKNGIFGSKMAFLAESLQTRPFWNRNFRSNKIFGPKMYWHDKNTVSHPKVEFSVRELEFFGRKFGHFDIEILVQIKFSTPSALIDQATPRNSNIVESWFIVQIGQ